MQTENQGVTTDKEHIMIVIPRTVPILLYRILRLFVSVKHDTGDTPERVLPVSCFTDYAQRDGLVNGTGLTGRKQIVSIKFRSPVN